MRAMIVAAAMLAVPVAAAPVVDPIAGAVLLRDRAREQTVAYLTARELTTDIGPRLAGSDAEAHARDRMAEWMTFLGLTNVHIQTFAVPHWERGVETATTIGADPQRLSLTALGYSGATPAEGIDGDVVQFADLDALRAAPAGSLTGKIVYIDHDMRATQDGSSYGAFNAIRTAGPAIAASKGAAAYLHRSLATGPARLPHTGVTVWPAGVKPIPAAALSVPDAMQLTRLMHPDNWPGNGHLARLHLVLTPRDLGSGTSGNVVGEITGTNPGEVVLTGGHLDSWDLGTGAIDDAAGVGVTIGAAAAIADAVKHGTLPRPRRTIRVVAFGDEEAQGPLGGATYLKDHPETVVLALEADFGADRVWSLRTTTNLAAAPAVAALARVLAPLGIAPSPLPAHGGTDIEAAVERGAGVVDLVQDGTHYFDLHHSADDTFDKIDPAALSQAVAAYAATLWWAANTDADLRPAAPQPLAGAGQKR